MSKIINENIRGYAHELYGRQDVRTVLVEGEIGDYAAYVGIGSSEFVSQQGDKLSFEEAQIHFPVGLERNKYRR